MLYECMKLQILELYLKFHTFIRISKKKYWRCFVVIIYDSYIMFWIVWVVTFNLWSWKLINTHVIIYSICIMIACASDSFGFLYFCLSRYYAMCSINVGIHFDAKLLYHIWKYLTLKRQLLYLVSNSHRKISLSLKS